MNLGYKALMKDKEIQGRKDQEDASTSIHSTSKQMWSCLWKLNIKHKLKTFMWKCINNALPVNEAKQVWHIAPIQWESAMEKQGCFKAWWNESVVTRSRQDGAEHLGLTVNILWQVWKSRNELEFNNKQRHAMTTILKAQEEWIEFCEAYKDKEQMITEETTANQTQRIEVENAEVIKVKIATLRRSNSKEIGIGVTAMTEGDVVVAAWAIHERSYNCPQLDEAEAIKIAMSKLAINGWRKIIIQSCNKQLLQQIHSGSASNIKLHTLVEDILSLKTLFHMCSFCVISKSVNHISIRVSDYALDILHDEEWINPLCC
ncbi:uncharacterized protein LOC113774079 [Coffea eugenioides]|uniref:uncharacterized protein LOC113758738 n=1 Tax=Coffea eugenioides TaxID=49369 RepID=UPI000F6057DA|nr:uncharacterized protein LOC113758738 [Coffea eugenioides]XP_027166403.1 uncharacterized protein LOC113766407 [Coffea eugenioides]XP_027174451.1 uncharacterized protein LOC113774079 [Coffea eugenioides]